MKQKQVKAAPKNAKQTNAKKATPLKRVAAPVEEVEEEDVEEKVVATKKPAIKKPAKVLKKKVVEEVIESAEEEEDEDDDDEVEQDSDDEDEEEPMDVEAGDDEDDEEQEDDEQEDEEEDDEENGEGEDDEAPTEAAIDEEPTIPSRVKYGAIPPSVPHDKIIHIKKLPTKCRKIDIVQAFAQYGAIDQIHIVTTPAGTIANVAFKSEKAAQKAVVGANKKVTINNSLIEVAIRKPKKEKKTSEPKEGGKERFNFHECRDRSVCVKFLKPDTTEDQVKEHFAACGEIENIKVVVTKTNTANAFVTFTDKKALEAAKKLHHTILNKAKIGVYENTLMNERDPKLTILLKNKQDLESLEGEKVEKIFAKCGEISTLDVLCSKNILAIVSFKDEEAAKKAFKLNGKTEQGIELEITEYNPHQKKTSVFVSNLPRDCTEEDLTSIFSKAGEITNVILKTGFAIIVFKDTDGFCKSFLYNETKIRNKMIFLQPHSQHKKILNRTKLSQFKSFNNKRPAQNGNSSFVFKPKKPKIH